MATPKGGKRPGAGRKPNIEKYIGPITAAHDAIAARLPDLVNYAFELAEGVEVQETLPNGTTKVYSRPPDIKAIVYLVDRLMGKPVQSVEMSGEDGNPIEVTADVKVQAARELEEWRRQMALMLPPPSNTPSA